VTNPAGLLTFAVRVTDRPLGRHSIGGTTGITTPVEAGLTARLVVLPGFEFER
jgi:hypothetical protein